MAWNHIKKIKEKMVTGWFLVIFIKFCGAIILMSLTYKNLTKEIKQLWFFILNSDASYKILHFLLTVILYNLHFISYWFRS